MFSGRNMLTTTRLFHGFPAVLLLVFLSVTSYAQTAAEIAAAKAAARAHGYSDKAIDAVLNNASSGLSDPNTNLPQNQVIQSQMLFPEFDTTLVSRLDSLLAADTLKVDTLKRKLPVDSMEIYGHSFLASKGLKIVPNFNAPAPSAYVLGPGDEVTIDIWGATVSHVVSAIGIDGSISVSDLGPVYISGMTLSSAEEYLTEQLSRIYSGLVGDNPDTYMRLSLGRIKGVSIIVSGEVVTPGLYSVPALATIPSVIFIAGGVNEKGSVRNISLFRHGKKVADFDLYDFLFNGHLNENLRIQDGDVLNVGAYEHVVGIEGAIMRSMRYEMIPGETVKDLIRYADGFDLLAQRTGVHVHRRGVFGNKSFDVNEDDFDTFKLINGDRVSVRSYVSNDLNSVVITGPVRYPGNYAIEGNIRDVASLIEAAGGMTDGAYLGRGFIKRLDEDRLPVSITFNLSNVLDGKSIVPLEREDSVFVFLQSDLVEKQTVTIEGHVQKPGTFPFSEGMTVADLILQAEGLRDDAYGHRGQIRRISPDGVPVFAAFNISDVLSGREDVRLAREDTVRIYSTRELREAATVNVGGVVNNPGTFKYYEGMTLEDLILTAGGFANGADMRNIQIASRGGRERGTVEIINIEDDHSLLDRQLAPYDIVSVRKLTYFRNQITITVNGEVLSPGPYAFDEAEVRLSDVMAKVGGFTDAAYAHGAKLTRVLTKEERERQKIAVVIANLSLDKKTVIDTTHLADRFNIGIDLEQAINNPGSISDVTLRDGDIIDIPILNNTVKVSGGVFYPNTVAYDSSLGWKDYVKQAGGFSRLARKNKTYAVYMNGKVAVGRQIKPEPGMELIVPEKKETEEHRMTPVEIASLASSTTSIATMVASLVKLFL